MPAVATNHLLSPRRPGPAARAVDGTLAVSADRSKPAWRSILARPRGRIEAVRPPIAPTAMPCAAPCHPDDGVVEIPPACHHCAALSSRAPAAIEDPMSCVGCTVLAVRPATTGT
jgi:hypothetical protein